MALDATLVSELDKAWASALADSQRGADHARERLRSNFDQDGRSIGASIANVMLLSSLPDQAMGSKLADRTPSPPAAPEYPNPPAQLNPAGVKA